MSSTVEHRIFTCDICGKTPLTEDEVSRVTVTFLHPARWTHQKDDFQSDARFDACRECLGTARVPNRNVEYEQNVRITYNDARDWLGKKVLKWFYPQKKCAHVQDGCEYINCDQCKWG